MGCGPRAQPGYCGVDFGFAGAPPLGCVSLFEVSEDLHTKIDARNLIKLRVASRLTFFSDALCALVRGYCVGLWFLVREGGCTPLDP